MLHYPDVMRKAQADIEDVVGSKRLPEFDDMAALPYIMAIINETLRFEISTQNPMQCVCNFV